jgi:hypothetical protein
MTTLSRRHAVHHAAETIQRPSDAQVISSCAHEAVPSAALPVREPHSVPQTAAARRSPRGSPEALHRLRPHVPSEGVLPRSTKRGVVRLGRPPLAEAALLDARRRGGVVGAWHRACRRRLAVRRGRASGTRKLRESSRDGGWEILRKPKPRARAHRCWACRAPGGVCRSAWLRNIGERKDFLGALARLFTGAPCEPLRTGG